MASTNIDLYVDEVYLVALFNDEATPISDEKYAQELTLQEALYSSSSLPSTPKTNLNHCTHYPTFPKIKIENEPRKIMKINSEVGESSKSKLTFCGICMESKQTLEIFTGLSACNHAYCFDCITQYVTSKIKESIALVQCPDPKCKQTIKPETCNNILPKEVFGRWENALCEALILGSQKFYCPYKECSALMINDGDEDVKESECPSCRRLFCAHCYVRWHEGLTCSEFQSLKEDERSDEDLMAMKLTKDKNWKRCSNCRFYVEKTEGCLHMTCRCHHEFCYKCGDTWSSTHDCA